MFILELDTQNFNITFYMVTRCLPEGVLVEGIVKLKLWGCELPWEAEEVVR